MGVKEGKSSVGTVIIWPRSGYLEITVPILIIKDFLEHLCAFTACKDAQSKKDGGVRGQGAGRGGVELYYLLLSGLGTRRFGFKS